ncbi:MAG: hypothetical protein EA352_10720 [Gemmatimonadales bacterium]|nr:MAG: hypothetical protein EA352_10720 [Gemmatimonadales bacterium]
MLRTVSSFVLLAALLLVGCSDSTSPETGLGEPVPPGESALLVDGSGLHLSTDRSAYQAGDTVQLALVNETSGEVGHNLCFAALEQEVEGEWVLDTASADRVCLTVLYLLPAGETADHPRELPADLEAGTWRVRAHVHLADEGEHRDVASPPFEVTP